jgi:hypothetical protein
MPDTFSLIENVNSNIKQGMSSRGKVTWRAVPLESADRSFDLHYWQEQTPEERFEAAWSLVETAYELKGLPINELRLQRTTHHFTRLPG